MPFTETNNSRYNIPSVDKEVFFNRNDSFWLPPILFAGVETPLLKGNLMLDISLRWGDRWGGVTSFSGEGGSDSLLR